MKIIIPMKMAMKLMMEMKMMQKRHLPEETLMEMATATTKRFFPSCVPSLSIQHYKRRKRMVEGERTSPN